jgi:PST family polysaccharide transporter
MELFDDNYAREGHGRSSLRGGAISIVARAINAVVQVGSVIFLARLLSPQDYGLVAMVTALTGFVPIVVDLGTRDAIVQRDRITRGEVSALFWITLSVGCGFAVLVAASGPLIAHIYGEPRLTAIALVSSLMIIASALVCQHYALLRRAMKFRNLAIIEVAANVLGAAVAIAMASYRLGYWALVLRPIITSWFLTIGIWFQCRWLPGKPTVTSAVKEMLKFGLNLIGFSGTDFVGKNSDRVAIGYAMGAKALGFYQNAFFIYDNLLDLLVFPLHQVAVVSLSKLQNNLEELRRSWAKALSTVAFFAMPAFGILAVTGQDLTVLLLGQKWSTAGILLNVLALRGIAHVVERTLGWLHVAAGRTDRWMRWGLVATGIQLVALMIGLPFGQMGVVCAYTVCMYCLFIPAIAFAGQPLGISAGDVVTVVGRQMLGALFAAAVGFVVRQTLVADSGQLVRMLTVAFAYVLVYVALVSGLLRVRTPFAVAWSLIRDVWPQRFGGVGRENPLREVELKER